ncbi:hypothetical protein OSB04_029073 [Centaurea solstitialis]|uniref:Uncharacterized protein n=1 Tax=Centaurea solstitialis TaxID=347529 RepID=A0AA38W187_9ASTR|nr:hypothetical protein OSB04_029073 [Centaurea solstitialis]
MDEKRFNQLISELGMLNPDTRDAKITALLKEDPLKNLATSPWPSIFLSTQGDLMHPASHLQHRVLHLRGRKTCRIPSSKRDDSLIFPPPLAGYLLLIRDYSLMKKKVHFSSPTSSLYWPISIVLQNIEPKSQVEIETDPSPFRICIQHRNECLLVECLFHSVSWLNASFTLSCGVLDFASNESSDSLTKRRRNGEENLGQCLIKEEPLD